MTEKENAVATANEKEVRVIGKKPFVKGTKPKFERPAIPEHLKNIILLVKNNAEIRRFTSLGIIDALTERGDIKGEKKYVEFKWSHFVVSVDGLRRDYRYTDIAFVNALVESFSKFANSAQHIINKFAEVEGLFPDETANTESN